MCLVSVLYVYMDVQCNSVCDMLNLDSVVICLYFLLVHATCMYKCVTDQYYSLARGRAVSPHTNYH